jgi:hypothetical protein
MYDLTGSLKESLPVLLLLAGFCLMWWAYEQTARALTETAEALAESRLQLAKARHALNGTEK